MRLTITRWGQIRDDAGYLCLGNGDTRLQTLSVSGAGGGHCDVHRAQYPASWHHISPRQLLITHYRASAHTRAAQYCANIDHDSHPSLNTPSVIIFTMGSKYLPSPV